MAEIRRLESLSDKNRKKEIIRVVVPISFFIVGCILLVIAWYSQPASETYWGGIIFGVIFVLLAFLIWWRI